MKRAMKCRLAGLTRPYALLHTPFVAVTVIGLVATAVVTVAAIPHFGLKGVLAWLVPFCALFSVSWSVCLFDRMRFAMASIRGRDLLLVLAIVVCISLFFYIWLSQEHTIYYWDRGTYWIQCRDIADMLALGSNRTYKAIYSSINNSTYNMLIPFLLCVPLRVCGGSFAAFVALVAFLFALPSIVLCSAIVRLIQLNFGDSMLLPPWLVSICFFGFAALSVPMIQGWSDALLVWPVFALYALVLANKGEKFSFYIPSCFGVCLLFVLLSRRYFAYWIVGFVIGMAAYFIAELVVRYDGSQKKLAVNYLLSFIVPGGVVLLVCLVFFPGFVERSVAGNYAFAYQAYDSGGGYVGKTALLIKWFGMVTTLSLVAASIASFLDGRARYFIMLLIINMVCSACLFWEVQDMGTQHYLLVAPEIFLIIVIGVAGLAQREFIIQKAIAATCVTLLSVYCCINFLYYSGVIPYSSAAAALFGEARHEQRFRDDFDSLQILAESIAADDTVWVAASSGTMCDSTLLRSFPQFDIPYTPKVIASNIDLRDGFKTVFFDANKVVVCNPVQLHKAEQHQRVVALVAPRLLDESDSIGKHYIHVDTFELQNGITAFLLEKTSDYTANDVRSLEREFDLYYAAYPNLFHDRFETYIDDNNLD